MLQKLAAIQEHFPIEVAKTSIGVSLWLIVNVQWSSKGSVLPVRLKQHCYSAQACSASVVND